MPTTVRASQAQFVSFDDWRSVGVPEIMENRGNLPSRGGPFRFLWAPQIPLGAPRGLRIVPQKRGIEIWPRREFWAHLTDFGAAVGSKGSGEAAN